jgi:hypothetical protein
MPEAATRNKQQQLQFTVHCSYKLQASKLQATCHVCHMGHMPYAAAWQFLLLLVEQRQVLLILIEPGGGQVAGAEPEASWGRPRIHAGGGGTS